MKTTQRPRFQLYKDRTFSQKFDATFAFMQENWRPMCKFLLMFIVPISIVSGLGLSNFLRQSMDFQMMGSDGTEAQLVSAIVNYGVACLTGLVGGWVVFSMTFALMQCYAERQERLAGVTWAELKPFFLRALRREAGVVGLYIAMGVGLVALIVATIALLQLGGLALTLVFLLAYSVVILPLLLAMPIAVFEDISAVQAVAKAWRLGFATWGAMFCFTAVITIIIYFLSTMISMPFSMLMMVQGIFFGAETLETGMASSVGLIVVLYLLSVVTMTLSQLLSSIFAVAIAVQYGHAAERVDGVATGQAIETFEQITGDAEDAPTAPAANDEISSFEQL